MQEARTTNAPSCVGVRERSGLIGVLGSVGHVNLFKSVHLPRSKSFLRRSNSTPTLTSRDPTKYDRDLF
jgi:hypothetical protein